MSEPSPLNLNLEPPRLGRIFTGGTIEHAAASTALRLAVEYFTDPENQAYMVGCMLTAPLTVKMRPVAGILVTMCGGLAARHAYRASRDLRELAEAAKAGRDADPPVKA